MIRYSFLAVVVAINIVLVTSACTQAPTPTSLPTAKNTPTISAPKPTITLKPSIMPSPTQTPRATTTLTPKPSPTPTLTPTPMPPRSTATPYPVSGVHQGEYVNYEVGIRLRYPSSWQTEKGDNESILAYFIAPQKMVVTALFAASLLGEEPTDDLSARISRENVSSLNNLRIESQDTKRLDKDRQETRLIATGTNDDGVKLKAYALTIVLPHRYCGLLVFVPADAAIQYQADINSLMDSLRIEAPRVAGISREQALVIQDAESTNPRDYDPATTHSSGDKRVYSGLVSFDTQLRIVPELAESWQITDGITYTFKLRTNAKFHNGKPVHAQDFIYAWERAANPQTKSDTILTYLGDVVGVKEMHAGTAQKIAGIQALDDHTLQVVIDSPKPYFLLKLTMPVAVVLDREDVESSAEWFRAPNGTGPYRLTRWERFKQVVYERNDDYYLKPPEIRFIVVNIYGGVGLRLYEAGTIDITGVSAYDVARVQDPQEPLQADLLTGVSMCTSYIVFDVDQPPFDDVKVRQAFALSFDRQKYLDIVLHGVGLAAKGLFPPALPGYNLNAKPQPYDPARARQLIAESKYKSVDKFPSIVYSASGSSGAPNTAIAFQIQMWQQALGVQITIENIEPDKYLDEINAGHHGQLMQTGWCADYPDPENFADALFFTNAQHNWGHYANPKLDQLLEQARAETDTNKRIQMYQQAEQLLVEDAAAIFVSHGISYILVKPYITGYVLTPIGIPVERYLKIDARKLSQN